MVLSRIVQMVPNYNSPLACRSLATCATAWAFLCTCSLNSLPRTGRACTLSK